MAKAIIALVENPSVAQGVVRELTAAGFARDDIGLLAKDAEDRSPEDDAATRATVAQSNYADANLDVGTETAPRGLPEALARLGVPEREARFLSESMGRGAALISVTGDESMLDHARAILERHRATNSERCAVLELPESGTGVVEMVVCWEGGEPQEAPAGAAGAPDQTPEGPAAVAGVEEAEGDFRENFETTFKARGYTYDQCAPAYHYGYAIGTDPRYLDQNWMAILEEIRREWGSREQGTWEEFEGAVRYGWDRGHGREQSVQVTL